jgi:hypothetical protein
MTNNPGGIRWQDGTPAYNDEVKKMTKEEKIDELTEWIVESMDVSALENYAKQQLEEYYASDAGVEDFDTNYAEMKEIKGDD